VALLEMNEIWEIDLARLLADRGEPVTLEAQEVTADARAAQLFVLVINVTPDPGAATPRADQPGFLDPRRPGRNCTTVLQGRDVSLCRNAKGSFEPCKN
jgi:hypothetical protein